MGAVLYMSKMPESCAECELCVAHYDSYEDNFDFQCADTKEKIFIVDTPNPKRDENCRLIGIDGNSIYFALRADSMENFLKSFQDV